MKVNNKETHFEVILTEAEYEPFKRLEGLTGAECYNRFGLKREESVSLVIKIDDTLELHLAQSIPYQEDMTTSTYGTLYDNEKDLWVDCLDPDDTILGEYCFVADDEEITIIVTIESEV